MADNKLNEKLSKSSGQIKLINRSCCALASRLDTSTTAFYNCLNIINYPKFTREVIHYGAN
jgi:hypothetical protein